MKRLNVIGIAAMQCNKIIPDSYTEVMDSHIEGVKAWRQACDYLLAFWKSRDDKKRLHGKFLKTRWEEEPEKFDMVRSGLLYKTEDYVQDSPFVTGGL